MTLDNSLLTLTSLSSSMELRRVVDKLVDLCELLRTERDVWSTLGHVTESDLADNWVFSHVPPWSHTNLTSHTSVVSRKNQKDLCNFPAHLIIYFSSFSWPLLADWL